MAKLRMARKLQDTRTAKIGEFCGSQGFFWFHLLPSISIHFSSSFVRSFQVLTGPLASCQRWHHCHHLQLPSTVAVWLCVSMQWLDTNSSDRMKWTCDEWNHDAIPLRNKEQRIATWIYPGNRQAGAQPIDALFWTDRCAAEPTEGWVRWAWDTRCQRYTSRFVHRMHWPRARCDLSAFTSASVTILCCSCVQWPYTVQLICITTKLISLSPFLSSRQENSGRKWSCTTLDTELSKFS